MPSLLKLSAVCALTSIFAVGCATTTQLATIGNEQVVNIHAVNAQGVGEKIGTVSLRDSTAGLVITTNLTALPAGPHGFHIHEKGSCDPAEKWRENGRRFSRR